MRSDKTIIESVKKVYNQIAPLFNSTRDYLWNDLKPLIRFVQEGDSVVDAGCGNGRLYQLFERLQVQYIGFDQSEALIELAKKRFPSARFLVSELTHTRLQEGIADVIFSIAAFHHLPSTETRIEAL